MRKVIQVVSSIDPHGKYFILAVCNDGSLWQLDNLYREGGKDPIWERFPEPPGTDQSISTGERIANIIRKAESAS